MSHPSDGFTGIVHPEVVGYLDDLFEEPDPLVAQLESHAQERNFPLIGRAAGRWLELLTRMIGGRRVFEFGSGYGFSAFFFARAVGEGGEVIGSECDEWEIEAHQRLFGDHSMGKRIDIRHGDAFEVFAGTSGDFDVVFMDIHKAGYLDALAAAVPRIRPGGLLLADNVLWGGKTARPAAPDDSSTQALRHFNALVASDERLLAGILPACDGLAVALRLG
jgi:predicted O-methyltransferase YrrM